MKKRFLALILCVIMVIGISPVNFDASVLAENFPTSGTCGDNIIWNYNPSSYTLTITGTGEMSDWFYTTPPWLIYDENIKNINISFGVTHIASSAFEHCTELTSITIPDSVTSIGTWAFMGCTGLTSIMIPDSVTSIEGGAFTDCYGLTSVTIGNGVTSIGNHAFKNCDRLTSITIPNSMTSTGDGTFYDCDALTSVTIPNSVTSIGDRTFYECDALTSVTIPDSITDIGESPFGACNNLENIYYNGTIAKWCEINFSDYSMNLSATNLYINGTRTTEILVITKDDLSGVTSIGDYAFYGFTELAGVTISDSVTSIGRSAFSHCSSLVSLNISNSVTNIGQGSFMYCTRLHSVIIPDGVLHINQNAFACCSELTSITLSTSVTDIGKSIFTNCTNFKDIYYYGSESDWDNITINNFKNNNEVLLNAKRHYYTEVEEQTYACGTVVSSYSFWSDTDPIEFIVEPVVIESTGNHTQSLPVLENEVAATCLRNGHYDSVVYCSVCGYELSRETFTVNANGHSPAEAVTENEIAASCTENGSYESVIYCSACGRELQRVIMPIRAKGHVFTNYVSNNNATCLKDGTKTAKCNNCYATNTVTDKGTAFGHDIIHHNGKASTCKEKGYADYDTCSRCDYTTYSELPFAEHKPAAAIRENEVASTCEESGKYDSVVYCSVCGDELSRKTETIAKTGHKDVNNDGVCDNCEKITDEAKHNTYLVGKAKLNVKSSATVDYRAKVTVTATASGVTSGYYLAVYEGNALKQKGDNKTVTYEAGEMTADKTFTVKIIDNKNAVQKDSNGNAHQKNIEVKVKQGFFDKLIAFFRGLFGALPKVTIKP